MDCIVLFDSKVSVYYKCRIAEYQSECPQIVPIYVEPENGRLFAQIIDTKLYND